MITAYIDAYPKKPTEQEPSKEFFEKLALRMVNEVKKRIQEGEYTPNAPLTQKVKKGTKPLKDTGHLLKSIAYHVETEAGIITIGSNLVYARIQDLGGTILPKNVKMLPMPYDFQARQQQKRVATLREIKGLKLIKTKNAVLLVKPKTKKQRQKGELPMEFGLAKFNIRYILKPKITIPSRPYLKEFNVALFVENNKKLFHQYAMRLLYNAFQYE